MASVRSAKVVRRRTWPVAPALDRPRRPAPALEFQVYHAACKDREVRACYPNSAESLLGVRCTVSRIARQDGVGTCQHAAVQDVDVRKRTKPRRPIRENERPCAVDRQVQRRILACPEHRRLPCRQGKAVVGAWHTCRRPVARRRPIPVPGLARPFADYARRVTRNEHGRHAAGAVVERKRSVGCDFKPVDVAFPEGELVVGVRHRRQCARPLDWLPRRRRGGRLAVVDADFVVGCCGRRVCLCRCRRAVADRIFHKSEPLRPRQRRAVRPAEAYLVDIGV